MPEDPKAKVNTPSQIVTVTRYSFLNYVRSKRFLVMMVIVGLVNVGLTAVVAYTKSPAVVSSPGAFYGAWWGNFNGPFLILTVVFFGGDAISGEFQNKTGYFLVALPMRKSTIYVGKFIAALIASSMVLALFFVLTLANGVYYFGTDVPYDFLESALFAWVVLLAALSFTFMFSSLFKSAVTSVLLTVIMILFVFTIVQALVTVLLDIEPWFLLSYAVGIVDDVLMMPYPAHHSSFPIPNTWNPTVPEGLAILAGYFLICGIVGLVLFERKEFT
jgi:ABC-2 type transport system permease protein